MTYQFDPELKPWVAMLPSLDISDLAAARAEIRALAGATPAYQPLAPLEVRESTIPGLAGAPDVPVIISRPADATGPLPALIFMHGGGFVVGSAAGEQNSAARIADRVGVVVISVDYRLAPEHPFPAGLDDCLAALHWVAGNATELGVDVTRIGVGGDSAGAGLAAGLALRARDEGGPPLCFQYLGIPEIDDALATASMVDYVDTPIWRRPSAVLSWQHYLGSAAGDKVSAYAAPSRSTDLSGLPPAYVMVCQFDPLRDEGIDYARRLAHAGVAAELRLYPGTFHGSVLIEDAAVSRRMIDDTMQALRRGLGLD